MVTNHPEEESADTMNENLHPKMRNMRKKI